jgi:hypothetical protein
MMLIYLPYVREQIVIYGVSPLLFYIDLTLAILYLYSCDDIMIVSGVSCTLLWKVDNDEKSNTCYGSNEYALYRGLQCTV